MEYFLLFDFLWIFFVLLLSVSLVEIQTSHHFRCQGIPDLELHNFSPHSSFPLDFPLIRWSRPLVSALLCAHYWFQIGFTEAFENSFVFAAFLPVKCSLIPNACLSVQPLICWLFAMLQIVDYTMKCFSSVQYTIIASYHISRANDRNMHSVFLLCRFQWF